MAQTLNEAHRNVAQLGQSARFGAVKSEVRILSFRPTGNRLMVDRAVWNRSMEVRFLLSRLFVPWPKGEAVVCKTTYAGSSPVGTSIAQV